MRLLDRPGVPVHERLFIAVVWAGLSGLVLALLMQPAAIPLTARNGSGSSVSLRKSKFKTA